MDAGYLSQRLNAVSSKYLMKMHVKLDTVAITLIMCFCLPVIKRALQFNFSQKSDLKDIYRTEEKPRFAMTATATLDLYCYHGPYIEILPSCCSNLLKFTLMSYHRPFFC